MGVNGAAGVRPGSARRGAPTLLPALARLRPPLALIEVGASAGLTLLFDRYPYTWRAGLDLNPLDVTSDDDVRWLSCLVWPDEGDREQRLAAAVAAARRDPPAICRGDLRADLPALAAQVPPGATLVIYHSAVLAYLPPAGRQVAGVISALPAVWQSNEGPGVVPGQPVPPHQGIPFVLARDGRAPLALTDSHGTWLHWLPVPGARHPGPAAGR